MVGILEFAKRQELEVCQKVGIFDSVKGQPDSLIPPKGRNRRHRQRGGMLDSTEGQESNILPKGRSPGSRQRAGVLDSGIG